MEKGFVLINFEKECIHLLILFHLSKKYVFFTYNNILLNITKNNIRCKI